MYRLILVSTMLLLLGACSSNPSVSEFQCKAGDWESVGYRDGASGMRNTEILAHQEACGEYGIVPDRSLYISGWEAGLQEYCTVENGFNQGQRGVRLNPICQGAQKHEFANAYNDGRKLYLARHEVNRIRNQLDHHDRRLVYLKKRMVEVTAAQLNPTLTAEQRINMLADLDALKDERNTILDAIPILEEELYYREIELEQVNQELAQLDYGY